MTRALISGNVAAAWGARLAEADYIPAFPITPQTEIIETIAQWIDAGEFDGRMVTLDSEHSMITAAGAAAATGVRVFTATSSQGLLYGMEMIYTVAGWRVPLVMVNVSRALAAPITLEADHNDVLATRDSGFLQIHCANCQEVLDTVLIAYRLAEDERVRLPVIVNMDGFYLSFTREPVEFPEPEAVRRFLPAFDPRSVQFRASRPLSEAVVVLGGSPYSYFRYEMHLAALAALTAYDEIADAFAQEFGRHHGAIESYRLDDAEVAFFMIGSFATKAKEAVDRLRKSGVRAGLLRPRLLRPFPAEANSRRAFRQESGRRHRPESVHRPRRHSAHRTCGCLVRTVRRPRLGEFRRRPWAGGTSARRSFWELRLSPSKPARRAHRRRRAFSIPKPNCAKSASFRQSPMSSAMMSPGARRIREARE